MFTKRFAITLFVIVILLAVCTACDTSTPTPSTTAQPMLDATQLPIAVTSSKVSTSLADDDWLIRVANGVEDMPAMQSSEGTSQPSATRVITTSPGDDDWLIRVANGE